MESGGRIAWDRATPIPDTDTTRPGRTTATMSTKRKTASGKAKNRPKSRKVEYDEEDISSEHDSEVDDAEAGSNADGEDAAAEDALADVSNMPELPAPEVMPSYHFPPAPARTTRPSLNATRTAYSFETNKSRLFRINNRYYLTFRYRNMNI